MKTEDLVLYAALGVAAYFIYKGTLGASWSKETGERAFERAGADVTQSTIPSDAGKDVSFVALGDTTLRMLPGDWNKFNIAQKVLLTIDSIVPGTWLSKLVVS
jgi:hypothetical protein